jgi:2,4-dienoyl-CoA reductase-like NADH-dependent reductase (Old Yellow Enzyme family)
MEHQQGRLFQPCEFGALHLRNRVVMAPMTRRMAEEDGIPTPAMVEYYRRRAAGEVGLILSEGTAIDGVHAFDTPTVPRFETDAQIAAWKQVVDAVHEEGGAFAPQLWHTGVRAENPIGPSEWQAPPGRAGAPRPVTRPMDDDDFAQVLGAFRDSARYTVEIGCDALEIHGAHGYLLDSFMNPVTNTREDRYGGSVENRMRFPLEVARTIRETVGPDFPVIYRYSQWNSEDDRETKFRSPRDLQRWVDALRDAGVDIIHVSTRNVRDPGFPESGPMSLAAWTRKLSRLPVIGVGMVSLTLPMDKAYDETLDAVVDPEPAIHLVEDGSIDLLAVGRALLANPDWVQLVRSGRWRDLKPFHKTLLKDLY